MKIFISLIDLNDFIDKVLFVITWDDLKWVALPFAFINILSHNF